MNNVKSERYGFSPEKIGKENLKSNVFRMKYNFHRFLKVKKDAASSLKKDNLKKDERIKIKLA